MRSKIETLKIRAQMMSEGEWFALVCIIAMFAVLLANMVSGHVIIGG